jgi:hypothetical protein
MLYETARRYDEWRGENYEGTSLRGAMKGWHKHGVTTRRLWKWDADRPGRLTVERAADARRRPLGAYFRVSDSDVAHVQTAIVEGDAVLASAWIHAGWAQPRLLPPGGDGRLGLLRIPFEKGALGLHAFALIGYGPEGFIVQNSWGDGWGTGGLAVLAYEDWMENRQDAWVARPGPETWDVHGRPRIYLDGFEGIDDDEAAGRAGSTASEWAEIDREALPFLINTGDRGDFSTGGRLETDPGDVPAMAAHVRRAEARDGFRDVVLYAHGGIVSESSGIETAGRLWRHCRRKGLTAYFFVWETGIRESVLGMIRSRDDAAGPRAGLDLGAARGNVAAASKELLDDAQRLIGRGLAGLVREGWTEMKGRAEGAAAPARPEQGKKGGGAWLFADALFQAMTGAPGAEPFRLHLFGHSAGAIYLAFLFEKILKARVEGSAGRVTWGTIQLFAPAVTVARARQAFAPGWKLAVPKGDFRIHTLRDHDEEEDNIVVYPSSLLTYVADCIESDRKRVPLLGIRKDLKEASASLGSPTWVKATVSTRHGAFDDDGHEIEKELAALVTS